MSTISISPLWTFSTTVGAPRVAAIEHPFGLTMGRPDDVECQMAVLRATMDALTTMSSPGEVVHLPFCWDSKRKPRRAHPRTAPPIVSHLRRKPWQLIRLLSKNPPAP
ncbi:MAG: hypothetical protein HN348_34360 [Proteobacteria bacterium]|jgi:glycine reductase complex component B subunit gamma|nr:hypothetical protein [Pseudomonadota bacterium]